MGREDRSATVLVTAGRRKLVEWCLACLTDPTKNATDDGIRKKGSILRGNQIAITYVGKEGHANVGHGQRHWNVDFIVQRNLFWLWLAVLASLGRQ